MPNGMKLTSLMYCPDTRLFYCAPTCYIETNVRKVEH